MIPVYTIKMLSWLYDTALLFVALRLLNVASFPHTHIVCGLRMYIYLYSFTISQIRLYKQYARLRTPSVISLAGHR